MAQHAQVESTTGNYPVFEGRMHYIDGYDPVSLHAPHSSLLRTSTWVGMGILLATVIGIGTAIFGFASHTVGSQEHWAIYATIGVVLALTFVVVGSGMIYYGRRYYRQYRAETGRVN